MRQGFWTSLSRIIIASVTFVVTSGAGTSDCLFAQPADSVAQAPEKKTTEPVFRVSKLTKSKPVGVDAVGQAPLDLERGPLAVERAPSNNIDRIAGTKGLPNLNPVNIPAVPVPTPKNLAPAKVPHPLDRAVSTAELSLTEMQREITDYTAILAKREQINGVIGDPSYMNLKIRCPRTHADGTTTPFSIYMKFLRPKESAGREVIWVDGQNENKLVVHEGSGLLRFRRFYLDPNCMMAMRGQRYPIYEAGLENLIVKLIEKAERDRAAGPCSVDYREGAEINKRPCSMIELIHNERRAPYEFHKAQVFIDDELQVPVRFAAYDWPLAPGADPLLLEEYTYYNVKTNVGLTDIDFNPSNPAYKFPKR